MPSERGARIATVNPVTRSVITIFAGLTAFFAAGGIVLGTMYVGLAYILPQHNDWKTLRLNAEGALSFVASVVVGSIIGGYVVARVAKHARFIHSVVVIALLYALHRGYVLWGPDTEWDRIFSSFPLVVFICLPFFVLGTWIGSRKRKQIERSR